VHRRFFSGGQAEGRFQCSRNCRIRLVDRAYPDPWILAPKPVSLPRVRLFCLPHAGGNATAYHAWTAELPEDVEMAAIQLPGRTYRIKEPPFLRMDALTEALIAALEPYMDRPFVMFGHSLGALTAFETVRRLRSQGGPAPIHLVVSGRGAPHVPGRQAELHRAPDGEFLHAMHRLFSMPADLLHDSGLMALSMPALRADFELMETWRYKTEAPLQVPVTAIGGCSDPTLPFSDLEAWREQTGASFESYWLPGTHFYLNEQRKNVLALLGKILGS
jgi:medium-chain acyl-[acyl-carrier-protein] hydrolase